MDAIILCGGRGTRLASVVQDVPKPLAQVRGRPFLEYLLDWLAASGRVDRVILATGHLAEKVEAHCGDRYGALAVAYSRETEPLGTGGAVFQALQRHPQDENFLVLNGDSFIDADIDGLLRVLENRGPGMALALHEVPDAARFGTVDWDGCHIHGFFEKRGVHVAGLINAGVYAVHPDCFSPWMQTKGPVSLEQDVIPTLASGHALFGLRTGSRFIDIGLPETYASAAQFFPQP